MGWSWSWVRSGFAVSCLMPATTCHGSGNDDNYVAPAPASSVRLRHLRPRLRPRLRLRIRIHILSFGPSSCLHLTAPWRHLTIDEDVEDDSVLVSTPASPLLAPCVVIVLVMAKTLSVVGCSHPGPPCLLLLLPTGLPPKNVSGQTVVRTLNCGSLEPGRGWSELGVGEAAATCVLDLRLTGTWTSSRLASTS